MIRKIFMFIAVEVIIGLLLVAAAVMIINRDGTEPVEADDSSEEGCIAGSFIATYADKEIAFKIQNAFLCGANLRYSSTNAAGLLVYNRPEIFD